MFTTLQTIIFLNTFQLQLFRDMHKNLTQAQHVYPLHVTLGHAFGIKGPDNPQVFGNQLTRRIFPPSLSSVFDLLVILPDSTTQAVLELVRFQFFIFIF